MTGQVRGWARATGLLLALVSLVGVFAAPALADTTIGAPQPVAGASSLSGVACSSATTCVAVGSNPNAAGGVEVVVPITNGIPGAATPVAGTHYLSEVACASATSCVAVGTNANSDDGPGVVVPITNGIPGAATPVAGTHYLFGVACASATSCVAVGFNATLDGVVVPITNGIPGTPTTVTGTSLFGVACASATSCVAVGSKNATFDGVVVPITNGVPGAPTTAAGAGFLYGVACASATSCVAAAGGGRGVVVPITNGVPGAPTTFAGTSLEGVACSSATSCVAVGGNVYTVVTDFFVGYSFNGGVVIPITNGIPGTPTPVAGAVELNGVACSSATSCLAVGRAASGGVVVPLTITTPPPPPSSGGGGGGTGNPTGGGNQSGGTGEVDASAPGVLNYDITNRTFLVGDSATPTFGFAAKAKKHKKGTTFDYTLSKAATVNIVIRQRQAGRRKGKRCVAPTRKLREAKKCTRFIRRATLTRVSHQGQNSVAFSGRTGSQALSPGSYEAILTATDNAGNTSLGQAINFRIVER